MLKKRATQAGGFVLFAAACAYSPALARGFASTRLLSPDDLEPNNVIKDASPTGLIDEGTITIFGKNNLICTCSNCTSSNCVDAGRDADIYHLSATQDALFPLQLSVQLTTIDPGLDAQLHMFARCSNAPQFVTLLAFRDDPAYPNTDPDLGGPEQWVRSPRRLLRWQWLRRFRIRALRASHSHRAEDLAPAATDRVFRAPRKRQ